MLELIFQGLFEWIYGMILEVWEYFCGSMIDIMSLDFDYLQTRMPVIADMRQVLLGVGWALLIGNLVFQATKSMAGGLGFEGEEPHLLFARTFVFAFLLLASPQICELGLNMTSAIMEMLDMPDAIDVHLVDDSLFGSLTANWLLVIIVDIILMFKVLKLLIAVAERYVILAVLTMTAPLAFATGGSRNTSDIFSGWCRMYGSMCLLMCVNIMFLKMLLSVVSSIPSGLDAFLWMVLVLAIANVAKKADNIITRIGLNPTISSSTNSRIPGMLSYIVVRAASSSITKAMGKSVGSSGRGRAPGGSGGGGGPRRGPTTPPGGFSGSATAGTAGGTGSSSPHSDSPSGAPTGSPGTTPATGTSPATAGSVAYSSESSTQFAGGNQVHNRQGGERQTNTQLNDNGASGGINVGGPRSTTQQQSTGSIRVNGGAVKQAGVGVGRQTRKSAVPPGVRRGTSHIRLTPINQSPAGKDNPGQPVGTAGTPTHGPMSGAPTPKPGTGPKASPVNAATRMSQVVGHQVKGGAVNSSVQAAEQSSVSIGQPATPGTGHPLEKRPAPGSATTTVTRETSQQTVTPGRAETRSTRRPDSAPPQSSAVPGTDGKPGVAGKGVPGAKPSAPQETRHSRNATSPASAPSMPRDQAAPARQEQGSQPKSAVVPAATAERSSPASQEARLTPAGVTPPAAVTASTRRPGTAGTATQAHRAAQGQQPAIRQAARAPSTPTAQDTRIVKRAASTMETVKKEQLTRKTAGKPPRPTKPPGPDKPSRPPKPPTLKGGDGHGR